MSHPTPLRETFSNAIKSCPCLNHTTKPCGFSFNQNVSGLLLTQRVNAKWKQTVNNTRLRHSNWIALSDERVVIVIASSRLNLIDPCFESNEMQTLSGCSNDTMNMYWLIALFVLVHVACANPDTLRTPTDYEVNLVGGKRLSHLFIITSVRTDNGKIVEHHASRKRSSEHLELPDSVCSRIPRAVVFRIAIPQQSG